MIKHFKKLNSPLHSIFRYPTLADQKSRFLQKGWQTANPESLWDTWQNTDKPAVHKEAAKLDPVEPFDEWEEFVLFASHYFTLTATRSSSRTRPGPPPSKTATQSRSSEIQSGSESSFGIVHSNPKGRGLRRFACVIDEDDDTLIAYGGAGVRTRLGTCDIYIRGASTSNTHSTASVNCPSIRMCHASTTLCAGETLVLGGRTSPDTALRDCCIKSRRGWRRVDDLQLGRYRHCATPATATDTSGHNHQTGVLVFGGKADQERVLADWVFWTEAAGWRKVETDLHSPWPSMPVEGWTNNTIAEPEARFGASMMNKSGSSSYGWLSGGLRQDGTIVEDFWEWSLVSDRDVLKIVCRNRTTDLHPSLSTTFRFGASTINSCWGTLLIGGVTKAGVLRESEEVLVIDGAFQVKHLSIAHTGPRPLLIGVTAHRPDHATVLIAGGGAVCFSFGSFWNEGYLVISPTPPCGESNWHLRSDEMRTTDRGDSIDDRLPPDQANSTDAATRSPPVIRPIPRVHITTAYDFEAIVEKAEPVVVESLSIGACTGRWTDKYLVERVGEQRPVVVHECSTEQMSFQDRNFAYKTMSFGGFMAAATSGRKLYLRALSANRPAEMPTKLEQDFPSIAQDFALPPELATVSSNAHSSPLRISGPVRMWLHYDVMANVLCQVRGKKRLRLYPPADVKHLNFAPGASSSNVDVFEADVRNDGELAATHPHEALLEPGDILFIPALWLHAASPTGGLSVAVNVFFHNLRSGYAAGRDVYGNRDLQAYERGRREIGRMIGSFSAIPRDMSYFYLSRLADELKREADSLRPS